MTVYQLPVEVGAFTRWLAELTGRARPEGGWYGVFAARDPEGLRACLDGADILPWDVVESLCQDAGEPVDGPFATQGRFLYEAAARVHDDRPGGAAALAERRDLMEAERRYAETRGRELAERLRGTPDPAEAARVEHDLAWTRDDHARASARVRELTGRLAGLGRVARVDGHLAAAAAAVAGASARTAGAMSAAPSRAAGPGAAGPTHAGPAAGPTHAGPAAGPTHAGPAAGPAHAAGPGAAGPAPAGPAAGPAAAVAEPVKAARRPRGARYAWLEEGAEAVAADPAPLPTLPAGGAVPRGARFGGVVEPVAVAEAPTTDPAEADRAAANAVYALRRLRAQGRSGEAHALLCEALGGPPARLPALAEQLHRAGLGADWSTLLWEAASLPPARLAAVAGVLADAGRTADCEQLLRQGVSRPAEELAGACAALRAEGHHREAHALLTAFVRVRTPEDAARLAAADPHGLVPRLLAAARAVSGARERDLLHALRVAGLAVA
ncbi:UL36 very large tegument protein [Streptomyces sp. NPDC008122]|uniref:UL36 very large tegument protein n=1 Tax=Streptomyces sp. NPDC008122 TaxID=3364810 RepID=UPI0036EE2AD2